MNNKYKLLSMLWVMCFAQNISAPRNFRSMKIQPNDQLKSYIHSALCGGDSSKNFLPELTQCCANMSVLSSMSKEELDCIYEKVMKIDGLFDTWHQQNGQNTYALHQALDQSLCQTLFIEGKLERIIATTQQVNQRIEQNKLNHRRTQIPNKHYSL